MSEKTVRNWLIFGIIVIILAFIFVLTEPKEEQPKPVFTFPASMVVQNYSGKSYIDTIAMVTLYNIMEYDSINLSIHDMPYNMSTPTHDIAGYMTVNPYQRHVYFLFVDPQCTTVSNIDLIAHEMVHIQQYESGDLKYLMDNSGVIYKGDTIRSEDVPYDKRPHEIDAFAQERILAKSLNKMIYNR
jgi:hypothetical protein